MEALTSLRNNAAWWARYLSRNHDDEQLLTGVISFGLGIAMGLSAAVIGVRWFAGDAVVPLWLYALALYLASTVVPFHFGEFYVATRYRPTVDRGVKAFMLVHSPAHLIASVAAFVEFFLEAALVPDGWKLVTLNATAITLIAAATLAFYAVRLVAMAQCGANFSLAIEEKRRPEHKLVTTGVYSVLRHPSYFGWYWRAALCQLILMNPVCFVGFNAAAWLFFKERIPEEEALLGSDAFFGAAYENFKKKTVVGIPLL